METRGEGHADRMEFWIIPSRDPETPAALIHANGSVELFVEDLDSFSVTDADIPHIQAALLVAQCDGAQAAGTQSA